jgi:hypothetical protein
MRPAVIAAQDKPVPFAALALDANSKRSSRRKLKDTRGHCGLPSFARGGPEGRQEPGRTLTQRKPYFRNNAFSAQRSIFTGSLTYASGLKQRMNVGRCAARFIVHASLR